MQGCNRDQSASQPRGSHGFSLGVERVGVPLAESSYFATFADSSCCVALSASVLALSAKKIQKVTIKFALFQQVQLF